MNNKTPHTINGESVLCSICGCVVNHTWKDSTRQLQQCSNHHGFHQDCLLGWLKRHRADCTCCSCQPPVEGEQESAEWYMVLLNESCPCCRCELNLEATPESKTLKMRKQKQRAAKTKANDDARNANSV